MTHPQGLPSWNAQGFLPPIAPGESGNSALRSPYLVELSEFIDQFAFSPDRIRLLEGFLKYRAELHGLQILSGFQWLNGSFLEDIETLENRSPRDIDAITFFHMPPGLDEDTLVKSKPFLFDSVLCQHKFKVDAYISVLGNPMEKEDVQLISYWYSMWSHRRSGFWKGFAQIDLAPDQDVACSQILADRKKHS